MLRSFLIFNPLRYNWYMTIFSKWLWFIILHYWSCSVKPLYQELPKYIVKQLHIIIAFKLSINCLWLCITKILVWFTIYIYILKQGNLIIHFTDSSDLINYMSLIRYLPPESPRVFSYWLSNWTDKSSRPRFWKKCRNWIQHCPRRWGKFVWYCHRWGYTRRNHQIEKGI